MEESCKVCGKPGHRTGECTEANYKAQAETRESEARVVPKGFDEKVENLLFQKEKVPGQFLETVMELQQMARGGNADGIRESYYSGWTNEHFKTLLDAIGEQTPDVEIAVETPESSEDLESVSLAERFVDHLDEIDKQIEKIGLLAKKIVGAKIVSLDADVSLEEKEFDELIQNFQVNGRNTDLTKLFETEGYSGVMNGLIDARNHSVREQGHGEKTLKRFDVRG
jgi:hypothetical protein